MSEIRITLKGLEMATEAIDRGVQLLDKRFGPGWVHLIHLKSFDITNGNHCVLGQVFGDGSAWRVAQESGYFKARDSWAGVLNGYVQDFAFSGYWKTNVVPDKDADFGFNGIDGKKGELVPLGALQPLWLSTIKRLQSERTKPHSNTLRAIKRKALKIVE